MLFLNVECLPCFVNCSKTYGCAGPNKILNSINGCFRCDAIVLDRFGEQVSTKYIRKQTDIVINI